MDIDFEVGRGFHRGRSPSPMSPGTKLEAHSWSVKKETKGLNGYGHSRLGIRSTEAEQTSHETTKYGQINRYSKNTVKKR